ncbi:hypothetical protein ACFTAO_49755 [Paenibacillus rhizoplanae]
MLLLLSVGSGRRPRVSEEKNIGKELVELLQQTLGDQVAIVLLSSEEALTFYPQIGFEAATNAFRIARKH